MSKMTEKKEIMAENENVTPPRKGAFGGPGGRGPGGPMGRGGFGGAKANNFKATLGKLVRYCKAYLPAVIIALVLAAGGAVFQIIGPEKISQITDEIGKGIPEFLNGMPLLDTISSIDANFIVSTAIMVLCFYAASTLLSFLQNYLMSTVTHKITKKMRGDLSKKIKRIPFSYFNKTSYGDVLSRITNDVDTVGQTLDQSIGTLVSAATMFVGSLVMMFVTNWIMALTAIGASLLGFVLMMFIMTKSQKHFMAQQRDLGKINGQIEETYSGHNVIKAYNASGEAKKDFEVTNAKLFSSAWKSQFLSGLMMPLMSFIGNLGYLAVCVVGGALVINGTITLGVIAAFMLYVRLFTQPLSQFAQSINNLQRTVAASERVFEFLSEKELEDESQKQKRITNVNGNVEFRNVKFGYTPDKTVINDFSALVKAGQKIAIVGPTGAGKTTMVNLLMRFYELDGGEISIDGIPINQVPRENVHEQFCMVLQDTWLFEGTIKENIIYSKAGVSDEDVVNACKTVGLHHFVMTLPDGYDTVLSDKASLSEGQKQLLTIARAIIKNSPLLILDEATSSVDTRTERMVQNAMDKLTDGRTSFIIAHRLSTIKNADMILVMKDGDIIESGNHAALMEQQGFYSSLYNSQFETAS